MIHLLRVCVISVVPALRCSSSTLNQNTPKIPSQSIRACWPISTVTNPVPSLLWGAFHSRHVQGSRSWKCAKCRLSEKLTDRHYIPSPCSGKNLHSIRCASPPPSFLWHIGLVTFLCFKLPELERLYAQTLQGTRAIVFFVFLAERAYPLTDAHQPPFWPGAEAGSRRLHSAETSLRTKNKKTKKDIPLPPPPPPKKKTAQRGSSRKKLHGETRRFNVCQWR